MPAKTVIRELERAALRADLVVEFNQDAAALWLEAVLDEIFGDDERLYLVPADRDDLVSKTLRSVIEGVPKVVRQRRRELSEKNIDEMIRLLMPTDPLADAHRELEWDNAQERVNFFRTIACLTSKQIAAAAGHRAANAAATASRWKKDGRIFAVTAEGHDLYPAFQFRDGEPHPAVAKILASLPKNLSQWQVAFWWVAGNGWLGGAAPSDRLDDEPVLIEAAMRKGEPLAG